MRYLIYFRTSRGGIGIPYELAKTEFLTVFRHVKLEIEREWWAKHRMWIELSLPLDEIAAIASDLGYTEAVLHLRFEPYRDEIIRPIGRGRWYVGWVREQEWKVYQTAFRMRMRFWRIHRAGDPSRFDRLTETAPSLGIASIGGCLPWMRGSL